MKLRSVTLVLSFTLIPLTFLRAESLPGWETTVLNNDFYAEGAGFGDIDGDGRGDIVSGPFWYKGPTFEEKHEFFQTTPFIFCCADGTSKFWQETI